MRNLARLLFIVCAFFVLFALLPQTPAQAISPSKLIIRLGSPNDVSPALDGPSFFFQGNGRPDIAPFQVHINQVANAPLDVVVLGASFPASGSLTPECDGIMTLNNVNSCTTVTPTKQSEVNDPQVLATVNAAEIVYWGGGNQCNYVAWQGTPLHAAVKNVVARGGGEGGGSAGLAIQGDLAAYDGCRGSVTSGEALANPYRNSISFTYDFFHWQNFGGTITDSHLVERNRMGRLMAFLCRQLQEGRTNVAYGVGVDANTSLLIDKNGAGRVYGNVAYVVVADHAPEQCVAKTPVTFSNYKIWKLPAGSAYNFAHRPTTGYYLRSVNNGVIDADPY